MGVTNKKYLDVKDVSEILGLCTSTIYNCIQMGDIEAIKFGKRYKIEEKEIIKIIESHRYISVAEKQKNKMKKKRK